MQPVHRRVVLGRAAGLWHVRGGPLATIVILLALLFTLAFPELSLSVSLVFDLPPRGVGTPEIVAVTLSSVLPAISVPRFDGREALSGRSARLGHLACSVLFLCAPAAVLPVWFWSITAGHPDEQFPGLHGLIGNVATFSCIGAVLCLLLGSLISVVATPVLFTAFMVGQQALPHSVLTSEFATGLNWHTNWWITAGLVLLALALSWRLRGTPLPNRP